MNVGLDEVFNPKLRSFSASGFSWNSVIVSSEFSTSQSPVAQPK